MFLELKIYWSLNKKNAVDAFKGSTARDYELIIINFFHKVKKLSFPVEVVIPTKVGIQQNELFYLHSG